MAGMATLMGMGPMAPHIGTPGIGDGMAIKPTRPKFFGEGGMGRYIAGSIGDMLLQNAGASPVFAQSMEAKRAREEEDRQLQNQFRLAEYRSKLERDRPRNPTEFEQALDLAGITDPAARREKANQRLINMLAPPLMAVDGFDAQGNPTKTFVPRTGIAPQAPQPRRFNALPPGAKPMGGPTPQASGGFR